MFTEGFTINGKHSFVDYGLHVKKRKLGFPQKNSIRKKIPFMNGYYDFSRINGGDTWGERTLAYTFDIIGDTPKEVEAECSRILNWLGNVHEDDIYEDCNPGYHWRGSFDSASPAESEDGEHTELTVTFVCHPFKIANSETVIENYRGTAIQEIKGQPVRLMIEATTGGYWYYRLNGAPIEDNKRADLYTGLMPSPFVLSAGEYIIGFAPTNLLVYPWASESYTDEGITFTANKDGTITANGTAANVAWFALRRDDGFLPPVGEYRLTGGKNADIQMRVDIYRGEAVEYLYEAGTGGLIINVTEDITRIDILYRIAPNAVIDNVTLSPALYGKVRMTWCEEVL